MTEFENKENIETNHTETNSVSFLPSRTIQTSNMPVRRQLTIIALLLIGIFGIGASSLWLENNNDNRPEMSASIAETVLESGRETESSVLTFADIEILAQGAIVIDVNTSRVLYEKSPDQALPLASITKLMTALVASELVDGKAVIPVTSQAISQAGESGLSPGETFSYKNLSDLVLLTSSNDGAYALSAYVGGVLDSNSPETAFVKAMNVRAKELGLTQTSFRNPTGLDITDTEAGAYGSARDVAKLMEYIIENYPTLLESTTYSGTNVYSTDGTVHRADNTNYVVESIPHTVASKTGYTTLAGGNLAVAFDVGLDRPVIVVVLGSTHQGRFSDVLKLVEAARSEIID